MAGVSVNLGLLTAAQVSEALGVTASTLANWRAKKKGPPWVKVGRSIRYREEALREWLKGEESR